MLRLITGRRHYRLCITIITVELTTGTVIFGTIQHSGPKSRSASEANAKTNDKVWDQGQGLGSQRQERRQLWPMPSRTLGWLGTHSGRVFFSLGESVRIQIVYPSVFFTCKLFSENYPKVFLLAICVALQYNVQRWTNAAFQNARKSEFPNSNS